MAKGFGLGGKNLDRLAAFKTGLAKKNQSEIPVTPPTSEIKFTSPKFAAEKAAETQLVFPKVQTAIERGRMPECVTYHDQSYRRDPHQGSLHYQDEHGQAADVFKYEFERSALLPSDKSVPIFIYVTYSGEIMLERGKTANPEQTYLKKINDPSLPEVGEIRIDDDGKKWRYESTCSAAEYFSHSGFDIVGPGWDYRFGINDYSDQQKKFHFGKTFTFTIRQLQDPRSIPKNIPYFSWKYVRDQE